MTLAYDPGHLDLLIGQRRARLHHVMAELDVPALLTADPFSVRYATGTRNMLVHGLTGPDRLALVIADGPTILWEFGGSEHLWAGHSGFDEMRTAPGLTAKKSWTHHQEAERFAVEVVSICRQHLGPDDTRLAVERLDPPVVDQLRASRVRVVDGTHLMQAAMMIKQPAELVAMREAMDITNAATTEMVDAIVPGCTEQEVWAEFQRALISRGGEFVVTRLLQGGVRTFPYFQEASDHVIDEGDLVCFDTDAVARHGYSVDFSRTFLCGEVPATPRQRHLYRLAQEQLSHNAANLFPGRTFEEFAQLAFDVPDLHREYGYYQLAHGLGLAGGHPNVPRVDDEPYGLPGEIEPGMVICVESYIGDPESRQGVKLEDQFLITDQGVETMSAYPFDERLSAT